jgi:transposase
MTLSILGIDVSKKKLDCTLILDGKLLYKSCENTEKGFAELLKWLKARKIARVHAALEATGGYEEGAAQALFKADHVVSVLNPLSVHNFAKQRLTRSKTDKIDAQTIAEYAKRNLEDLPVWQPPAKELTELRDLVNRRHALVEMQTQETNRLKSASGGPTVDQMVQDHLAYLAKQIDEVEKAIRDHIDRHPGLKTQAELLESIPGVGTQTAALFLAEIGPKLSWLRHAKQLVAYCGMDIRRHESGSSVWSRPRMSKMGNKRMRAGLYMPAMTAMQHNENISVRNERLKAEGKPHKLRVGAAMRKLLHQMFGVLTNGQPYDPAYTA